MSDTDETSATSVSVRLASSICREVLRLDQIGQDEDLFRLGANSIQFAMIGARLADATGSRVLPLSRAIADPTVEGLAKLAEAVRKEGPAPRFRAPGADRSAAPLSASQERVWLIHQHRPDSVAYHTQATIRFHGQLCVESLRRSLQAIVNRHEIFRTTFPLVGEQPVQRVHPHWEVMLPVTDLSNHPAQEQRLQALFDRRASSPFDIERLPLVRWDLVRMGPEDHVLIHVEHHLVHDGWSFNRFLSELQALYASFVAGGAGGLEPLRMQFSDYARLERRWLDGPEAEKQRRYWREQLSGCPGSVDLPFDHSRPAEPSTRGEVLRFQLDADLVTGLRELAAEQHCTLFMVAVAAFYVLLNRYSGQDDIVIGSGVANRAGSRVEELIGMIVNNVALRTDLSGEPTVAELLQRVRNVALEAYDHQELPFDQVVRAVAATRTKGVNPLFQVCFSFHDSPLEELSMPGLHDVQVTEAISNGSAKFDFNIIVIPSRTGGATVLWEYNTDVFDSDTVDQMAHHYRALLEAFVREPSSRIADIGLPEDRISEQWTTVSADFPRNSGLAELFEERVRQQPDAVAVSDDSTALTYAELNVGANQLAHYLSGLGIGSGDRVALLLRTSTQMIVATLGVLKAGAAYVPIDVAEPGTRLTGIVEDADVSALLCDDALPEGFQPSVPVVRLEEVREEIGSQPSENPPHVSGGEDPAYLLYTSGSTGQPKGVLVPQRAVTRLVINTNYVRLTPRDVVAQVANPGFDAATFEIWGALLNGARLVVLGRHIALSPQDFADALEQHRVSTLFVTTALFHLVAQIKPDAFHSVQQVLLGGESCDPALVRRVLEKGPPPRLINAYGPTETTTFATWNQVEHVAEDAISVPIGRPISNTSVFVLDDHQRPVPVGVPGELYIGGEGLATGYWNRPDLTAASFVENPFGAGRLYRTGDRCRWLADGSIDFLGRQDHQVKIRGFRVELGEIEAALRRHGAEEAAVHYAREEQTLIAAVVPRKGDPPDLQELRKAIRSELPPHMIPSRWAVLDSLPYNPNGKVDRAALIGLASVAGGDRKPALPRTPVEEAIADVWCGVLGIEQVGRDDDFFELGGHSLMATQVLSRVRRAFQVDVPFAAIFEAPTIAGLAERIDALLVRSLQDMSDDEATRRLSELDGAGAGK